MPLIPDSAVFQQKLGALPLVTYQAGENVLTAGSKSGQLLILKSGVVAIVKEDIEIAKVREPGAVLGELSALLDQPHTADVRALETSQFHVADASILLGKDPVALLYVASWRGGSTVPISRHRPWRRVGAPAGEALFPPKSHGYRPQCDC